MRFEALPTLVPDAESFLAQPPREPVVWRAAAHVDFGLDEVAELLDHGSLTGRMVGQVVGGARQPVSAYTWGRTPVQLGFSDVVRTGVVAANVAAGSTTVLEALHRTWAPVGDLCRRLSFETGVPWSANAYLTPEGSQGFAHHHDTHSVLIVQTSGSKTWQLHAPVFDDPLEHQPFIGAQVSEEEWDRLRHGTPFLEAVLEPGDALWIPRGWIHNGFATDDHSLHVSFSIPTLTPYWIANQLAQRLGDDPAFRTELPWGFTRSEEVRAHALEVTAKLLSELFAQPDLGGLAGSGVVDELADTWRTYHLEARRAPLEALRQPVTQTTAVRTVAESALGQAWTADGGLRVHLGDTAVVVEAPRAQVVHRLLAEDSPQSWTPQALVEAGLDEAAALELTTDLLRTGLARRA